MLRKVCAPAIPVRLARRIGERGRCIRRAHALRRACCRSVSQCAREQPDLIERQLLALHPHAAGGQCGRDGFRWEAAQTVAVGRARNAGLVTRRASRFVDDVGVLRRRRLRRRRLRRSRRHTERHNEQYQARQAHDVNSSCYQTCVGYRQVPVSAFYDNTHFSHPRDASDERA